MTRARKTELGACSNTHMRYSELWDRALLMFMSGAVTHVAIAFDATHCTVHVVHSSRACLGRTFFVSRRNFGAAWRSTISKNDTEHERVLSFSAPKTELENLEKGWENSQNSQPLNYDSQGLELLKALVKNTRILVVSQMFNCWFSQDTFIFS